MPAPHQLVMSAAQIEAQLELVFPDRLAKGWTFRIEHLEPMRARVRLPFEERHLRPGGTIAGPVLFHIADFAFWVLIMAMTGPPGVEAVTTNLSINFLRRPGPSDLIAQARIVKLGRRLVMGDVEISSADAEDMVAHATCTYAMPG